MARQIARPGGEAQPGLRRREGPTKRNRIVIRRLALALVTTAALCVAAPAVASPAEVDLISDLGFESANSQSAGAPWTCAGNTSSVTDGGPVIGSEFTQRVGPRDGEVPNLEPPTPVDPPRQLLGVPTAAGPAGCAQVVPVQPGATYQLRVSAKGGPVVVGTEFGTVASAGSTRFKALVTTFTTPPDASTVTVSVRGPAGGAFFYAQDVALTGPASSVRVPAPPTALRTDRQTSTSVRLSWRAAPGATGYRVLRDGVPAATTTSTAAVVTGLTVRAQPQLTVVALNPAGESAGSAPLTLVPVPAWSTVPDRPSDVVVTMRPGTAIVQLTAPARVTDGYHVYLDGVRAGWVYDSPASLVGLSPGRHTITLTALNVAGASAPSAPVTVTDDGT
jgi:hypothetical protein